MRDLILIRLIENIIEQCIEWQNKIIINFVDFEKAFDSLNRDNIWEIMKSYGIPDKIINIIKLFYNNYRCSVFHNGTQSSWFTVQSSETKLCYFSSSFPDCHRLVHEKNN